MDLTPDVVPRISVCMAAYNGSRHIKEQIDSILSQLGATDELIVVNDCSTDNTAEIVSAIDDDRIRLINSSVNAGYVRTFELGLSEARGEYIFLSDQDDIWIPGRVDVMIGSLQSSTMVASNCKHFDGRPGRFHDIRLRQRDSHHTIRNIVGILVGYRLHWGCAMAFRRSMLSQVVPFPGHMTESHDQWIAMVGNVNRSILYIDQDTILHRLHGENLTPHGIRGAGKILLARLSFFRNLMIAVLRARQARV